MRYIVGIIVAVIIYMSIAWFTRPKPPGKFASTDQMMTRLANDVVQSEKQKHNIDLDYSLDSINTLEQVLKLQASNLTNLANPTNQMVLIDAALKYGAYFGEVLRRHEGGSWSVDDPVGGPRSFPMRNTNNLVYFPVAYSWILLQGGDPDRQDLRNPVPIPAPGATNLPATPAPAAPQSP